MPAVSKKRLQEILTRRLRLAEPQFKLEKEGSKVFGSIISQSFRGKGDYKRQAMIWEALESELGPEAPQFVGTLLAYTPYEWNMGEEVSTKR